MFVLRTRVFRCFLSMFVLRTRYSNGYQVLFLFAPLLSPVPGMLSFNLGVYLYLRFCKRLMFYFYFFNIRDIAVSRRRRTDATADDVIGYVRKKMKTTTT